MRNGTGQYLARPGVWAPANNIPTRCVLSLLGGSASPPTEDAGSGVFSVFHFNVGYFVEIAVISRCLAELQHFGFL